MQAWAKRAIASYEFRKCGEVAIGRLLAMYWESARALNTLSVLTDMLSPDSGPVAIFEGRRIELSIVVARPGQPDDASERAAYKIIFYMTDSAG